MEITYQRSNSNPFKWLFILLIVIVLAVAVSTTISHGLDKHPDTYPDVIRCLNNGNPTMNFSAGNGRYIQFCMIDNATFGMRVLDKVGKGAYKEITAYIKENIHSVAELRNFIRMKGYQVVNTLPK